MTEEEITELRSDVYVTLEEDFLDAVFEFEATLPRDQWQKFVVEKCSYIFDP